METAARLRWGLWVPVTAVLLSASCSSTPSGSDAAADLAERDVDTAITVSSPAFGDGEPIPPELTCDGDDHSPPLAWQGVPDGAAELALVVDDPDAPGGTYVHWVVVGLEGASTGVGEATVPPGARQAANSAGHARYDGPCPPERDDAHRYRFTVYALDRRLDVGAGADLSDVLAAIGRTAVAKGTHTGTFDR
jgi:Raf kinase inhibitor-like YbhB/YbcL family protein